MKMMEIAWAAGFLEGEGHFGYYHGASMGAVQVQREPLERLKNYFGGVIGSVSGNGQRKDHYSWRLHSGRAIGVMMTLYSLMSPKRQEKILATIKQWKTAPGKGWREHVRVCPRGHEYTKANTKMQISKSGKRVSRICRTCANIARMNIYYRNRGGDISKSLK